MEDYVSKLKNRIVKAHKRATELFPGRRLRLEVKNETIFLLIQSSGEQLESDIETLHILEETEPSDKVFVIDFDFI
ncbi:hypothetical protein [Neobacillus cucumis]|uniref:hypothetical protein n=1 Tax=Neobacillus cucumis TaxID=1740721 RepID=UPI0028534F72|nr:hypothetical protein [Neobacillus cucumis]MDR4947116.1 hypothetical protein [Neobacillus cucumis]